MNGASIQAAGLAIAIVLVAIALVCAAIRIVRGPSGADRVVALDMLGLLGVAATGLAAPRRSGSTAFIDIALGVALVGFLATHRLRGFYRAGLD
jgi:multicomponent Na+:H+ antiporter subunit F